MKTTQSSLLVLALVVTSTVALAKSRFDISDFSTSSLKGWESKSFAGETDYSLVTEDGRPTLRAQSNDSASGLGKKVKIDLTKTPYLNWSWKIDGQLSGLDERSKSGDDYVARLYVVKSGGALIWKTKALNYVWSSNQAKESVWPNAFQPKNATMMAVRGKQDSTGVWVTEKRNVREDLKRVFGKDFKKIDAVALMTDTDNSGLNATAYYGEIFFTAE